MTKKDLVVIMCPPLSRYKEPPKDQSHSDIFDCPKCKCEMWLSDKKKGILIFSSFLGKAIMLACYDCIAKEVEASPHLFSKSERVDL